MLPDDLVAFTDSLSSQALAEDLGVFMDEEVLDRCLIVLSGRRL